MTVNILLADDHGLVRDLMQSYLSEAESFAVKGVADLDEAMTELSGLTSYDLALLDYNMPGMNGLEGLRNAMQTHPAVKFVLISGEAQPDVAREAMAMGAHGFVPKSLAAKSMVNAIRFLLAGERYFPFELTNEPVEQPSESEYRDLTPREIETLRGLCEGKSNKEIAIALDVKEVTIKVHVKNVLKKLGVSNRTHAALTAKQEGFE